MKKENNKDWNAVNFMRKRRDELSKLYQTDEKEFWKQLEEVRKRYKNKFHQKLKHTA